MSRPLIAIAEATEQILAATHAIGTEQLAVVDALDRVLREDVRAMSDVPPFPCSAMDGYAVLAGPAERVLQVVGESRAGAPSPRELTEGEAIRISTGAALPDGASAVIRQEDVEVMDGIIRTALATPPGEHIRGPGEDMRAGTLVLEPGTRLEPAALAATIAAGAGTVTVARRPRLQVLSTGDELRPPGEPLRPGEIHNSNAPMLIALAQRAGALPGPARQLPDDLRATEAALAETIDSADVVVVSGGVSVGPHDHVKPALASLGVAEVFWGVALAPGKPTWFGIRDAKLVFGLPGNPVSTFVTFSLFVRPALAAMQGAAPEEIDPRRASLGVAVPRNADREQALRVTLTHSDGRWVAVPNGPQGSHIISSLLGADALALIPRGDGPLEAGASVALAPLP